MAKREALRELQSRLAERLQEARTQPRSASWLAVEVAGQGLLFPLQQAGEIFSQVPLVTVPYTAPWFLGVANLRGGLHGTIDLAAFLGLRQREYAPEVGARDQARLIAFNPSLGINGALLVDRLVGLRKPENMQIQPETGEAKPAFAGASWVDESGRVWQEILLSALALDEQFLGVMA